LYLYLSTPIALIIIQTIYAFSPSFSRRIHKASQNTRLEKARLPETPMRPNVHPLIIMSAIYAASATQIPLPLRKRLLASYLNGLVLNPLRTKALVLGACLPLPSSPFSSLSIHAATLANQPPALRTLVRQPSPTTSSPSSPPTSPSRRVRPRAPLSRGSSTALRRRRSISSRGRPRESRGV
jgi:hypothetical protein